MLWFANNTDSRNSASGSPGNVLLACPCWRSRSYAGNDLFGYIRYRRWHFDIYDTAFLTGGGGIFLYEKQRKKEDKMDYPVIDPAGTGRNIRALIAKNGNTVTDVSKTLGLADKSTLYKWIRGDALPGIDNMLALSLLLGVTINDILATK